MPGRALAPAPSPDAAPPAGTSGRYLMVLRTPAFRSGPDSFEIESAFALHLRTLRAKLGPLARTLVVATPELSAAQRAPLKLERVWAHEGIVFRGLVPAFLGKLAYQRRLPSVLRALREEVEQADIIHAGPSRLFQMLEFPALIMARRRGKKTIAVTDVDHRQSTRMRYLSGEFSLRAYVTTMLLHDTTRHLQQLYLVKYSSLVLLKGGALSSDYGSGRPNVKNFLDSAFEERHLIPVERLQAKLRRAARRDEPLRAVYFGRLVSIKGIGDMLRATRLALDQGARLRLRLIGSGVERPALEALRAELGLEEQVSFHDEVAFGEPLFDLLYDDDLLLAAPQAEDTPRSALDAFAAGQALLAYDTYYYRELAARGAPVDVVPWRDHRALAQRLVEIERDRPRLVEQLQAARDFAVPNTQEAWLDRRVAWTRELFA